MYEDKTLVCKECGISLQSAPLAAERREFLSSPSPTVLFTAASALQR